MESINIFLSWESLYEIEIKQAWASVIAIEKHQLNAHKSLGKGGLILACNTLWKIKEKRLQEANNKLRKAKRAIQLVKNKTLRELKTKGVQAQKDKKIRLLRT